MKTWKQWTLVAIIAFFGIIAGFTACDKDNGTTEQLKEQTETLVNVFDGGWNIIINGYMTDSEWGSGTTGVVGKIETALNSVYNPGDFINLATFTNTLNRGVTIIVEKKPNYLNWKTTGDGKTLYLNYDKLNNLSSIIFAAFTSMESNKNEVE